VLLKNGVPIGAPGSPSVDRPWARLTEEALLTIADGRRSIASA